MFHTLKYDVTFPSTGRRLAGEIDFQPGYWAITGSNESGKTFILEMLRFALFGSNALRGAASDYATLAMSCSFSIKGERYEVARSVKKATLKRGTETITTGVSPVNAKIIEILGYGLNVFDMAHAINQGEVERLGSLTPMERKRLVDNVLGIDALDVVSKWAMEEARALDATAAGLRAGLVQPTTPEEPTVYVPTTEIDLDQLRMDVEELIGIEAFLANPRAEPVEPVTAAYECAALAAERATLRNAVAVLEAKVAALPESAPYTEQQLNGAVQEWFAFHNHEEAIRWMCANPRPTLELAEAEETILYLDQMVHQSQAIARQRQLQAQIDRAREQGSCTVCDTPFAHDHIAELEAKLALVVIPEVTARQLFHGRGAAEQAVRQWATFDAAKYHELLAIAPAPRPVIVEHQIPVLRAKIAQAAERACLSTRLKIAETQLAAMPDYERIQMEWAAYQVALTTYQCERTNYECWCSERDAKVVRMGDIWTARETLAIMQQQHQVSRDYEQALERFSVAWDRYVSYSSEADGLEAQAIKHRKVRDLMNILRSLIKQHLMPSLNRVASHLLSQMTGGQRTAIYVDEDFNVVVDRQSLDTLSGSGKACANLAIRIALGQVLTNRVMSVLLADEIDASMDEFRSKETSNTLWMLRDSISQILNVSHKQSEAANQICLGELSEHSPDEDAG